MAGKAVCTGIWKFPVPNRVEGLLVMRRPGFYFRVIPEVLMNSRTSAAIS
jgi:hypothetical protein